MDPTIDGSFYREIMEYFLEFNIRQSKIMINAGADVIEIGANLATSAVGPKFFKDYMINIYTSYTLFHNYLDWSQKQRRPEWMKLKSESKQFLDMKMVNPPNKYIKVLVKVKNGSLNG